MSFCYRSLYSVSILCLFLTVNSSTSMSPHVTKKYLNSFCREDVFRNIALMQNIFHLHFVELADCGQIWHFYFGLFLLKLYFCYAGRCTDPIKIFLIWLISIHTVLWLHSVGPIPPTKLGFCILWLHGKRVFLHVDISMSAFIC